MPTPRRLRFVLLHGGWHSSACWSRVVALLRADGHDVATPELPGHGTSARFPAGYFSAGQEGLAEVPGAVSDITLGAVVDVVLESLRASRNAPGDDPVVLVSHSSTGAVASKAAETAPELVDHLVYLAGIVPSRLVSAGEVGALPEYGSPTMDGLVCGDPGLVGALRINPRSTDPSYCALLRQKFYSDLPEVEADGYLNLLIPDQPLAYVVEPVEVTSSRWGSIPRTYLRTGRDQAIAPAVQDIMINDADALHPARPFRVLPIDSGHGAFASHPELVARLVCPETGP